MHRTKASDRNGPTVFDLPRIENGGSGANGRSLRRLLRADDEAARLIDEHVRILTKHKAGRKRR